MGRCSLVEDRVNKNEKFKKISLLNMYFVNSFQNCNFWLPATCGGAALEANITVVVVVVLLLLPSCIA